MKLNIIVVIIVLFQTSYFSCSSPSVSETQSKKNENNQVTEPEEISEEQEDAKINIVVGAEWLDGYLNLIENQKIGLVVNQTSKVGDDFLVDVLLEKGIQINKIFAPEHGFRGTADAGEKVKNGKDLKTGIDIHSLYGKNKKPSKSDLEDLDWIIFDIQDVGARFYTFISTMTYVMDACAKYGVKFLVLDRPNPNGHFIDGPVLKETYRSFVGLHKIPVVHGMTIGEYAKMVNGEGWLESGKKCDLTVIPCQNYSHQFFYDLPVKPSPNLPNSLSIALYPSLCFFEGTEVSIGRGTDKQFQLMGAPNFPNGNFEFIPEPKPGAKYPKHNGKKCSGFDLSVLDLREVRKAGKLEIKYLINFYKDYHSKEDFFLENLFFDKLAGGTELRNQIINGVTEDKIRKSWEKDLSAFKSIRQKYLIYEE